MSKNIMVTGGCGFIGSHFIEKLLSDPDVKTIINVDKLTYAANKDLRFNTDPRYKHYVADINDGVILWQTLNKFEITHVVNFAAETHVDNSIYSPDPFVMTNIMGTYNLIKAIYDYGKVEKFIHISTDEVYGSLNAKETSFNIDTPYKPNSPYAATKAASDLLVRSYFKTYKLPAIVTNCSNNYGPRQHVEKFIPTCIRKLKNKEPIPIYGTGENVRDWIYVKDHVNCVWDVLERGDIGKQYLIGGNNEISNIQLMYLIVATYENITNQRVDWEWFEHVDDRKGHDFRYSIDTFDYEQKFGKIKYYNFTNALNDTIVSYL